MNCEHKMEMSAPAELTAEESDDFISHKDVNMFQIQPTKCVAWHPDTKTSRLAKQPAMTAAEVRVVCPRWHS